MKPARSQKMNILTLCAQDQGGGAASVARKLTETYMVLGHHAAMAVGTKKGHDSGVFEIPDREGGIAGLALLLRDSARPLLGRVRGAGKLHEFLHCLGRPQRFSDRRKGIEDWNLPGSGRAPDLPPWTPDILHCHNLHSFRGPMGHFNLLALPELSRRFPVVLSLHDVWLTTGHCAHPLECSRWKTGCGECPDLGLYPPVLSDSTALNWKRKKEVFRQSRLFVTCASRRILDQAMDSILAPAIINSRVIPYGIDMDVYCPADRNYTRRNLGLPEDSDILLFAGQGIKGRSWKDYATMRTAMGQIAQGRTARPILFLAMGEAAPPERIGNAEIRFLPFQPDPSKVADYYRAADVYVHAAYMDTFPLVVLEAMACGLPVVATEVGGIPEQIIPLPDESIEPPDKATGILTRAGDAEGMARAISLLLQKPELRNQLGMNATRTARERFDLTRQAKENLEWYNNVIEWWNQEKSGHERKNN